MGIWSCGCHMDLGNYLLHCMFLALSATIVAMVGGDCWFMPWSMVRATVPLHYALCENEEKKKKKKKSLMEEIMIYFT